ncbi:hypothetical protein AB0425_05180 [Actinosynnema sp. NPDC051121]
MLPLTRILDAALTEAVNRYGTGAAPVLGDRGLHWEIDSHGVLRGVVPESCPTAEVLERLVNWAAVLDLELVGSDRDKRGVYTYRGLVEDRQVEVRGTVKPQPTTKSPSTAGTRPARTRHRRHHDPDPA